MTLKILFLEPFYGGSHKAYTDALIKNSRHEITLKTLPARFWKWRMRGAALEFYRQIPDPGEFDLLVMSDLMSFSDLKALWGPVCPPAVVYFHESQLSYPLPEGEIRDYQFGFTDVTSALNADAVVFNSAFHRDAFFSSMTAFLKRLPDHRPLWALREIRAKSSVLYPGIEPGSEFGESGRQSRGAIPTTRGAGDLPVILWNHRWEFDKQPDHFFATLEDLKSRQIGFRLIVVGENFQAKPEAFLRAQQTLAEEILHFGYAESREEYLGLLDRADIVISCAVQENYGISVLEAVARGCCPVLPNRLSYPEIIPETYRAEVLYETDDDFSGALEARLKNPRPRWGTALSEEIRQTHDIRNIAPGYDALWEEIWVKSKRNRK